MSTSTASTVSNQAPVSAVRPGELVTSMTIVKNLQPGQILVYYKGFLAKDREHRPALDTLACLAYELYRSQKVALRQYRNGNFEYEYCAVGL